MRVFKLGAGQLRSGSWGGRDGEWGGVPPKIVRIIILDDLKIRLHGGQ